MNKEMKKNQISVYAHHHCDAVNITFQILY